MTTFRARQFTMLMVAVTIGVAIQRPITFAAQDPQPVFKAGVALVPITALVRDSRNRIVRNLGLDDFQVFEGGRPRPIVDFAASDNAPINVAFLFDTSGSMHVASNLARGKDFVEEFVGGMEPAADRVALFTFDKSLRREVPFTKDRDEVYDALGGVKPWGLTSLYDAIAETAKQLGDRTSERRAVVVITDGVDTSSALTPAEVSGLASSIDVPVYVVAVVSPLDHPGTPTAVISDRTNGGLANVAQWTGGRTDLRQCVRADPGRRPGVTADDAASVPPCHRIVAVSRLVPAGSENQTTWSHGAGQNRLFRGGAAPRESRRCRPSPDLTQPTGPLHHRCPGLDSFSKECGSFRPPAAASAAP